MKKVIVILICLLWIICFCAPMNAQFDCDFDKLPKYKKEFFENHVDMAWYTYVKYDVPITVTLAFIAMETNYGRNKKMMRRGDLFGTGRTYKYTKAWDEFGRNMKSSYGKFPSNSKKRQKIITIKNEIGKKHEKRIIF
jgi:hypothetical protein